MPAKQHIPFHRITRFHRHLLVGILVFWVLITLSQPLLGWVPERRETQGKNDLGWFFAPTPTVIEGVGVAVPVFALLSNAYETTDLIGVQTLPGGDIDIQIALVDELPVFTPHLQFTGGSFNQEVSYNLFERGIDSDPDDYIVPFQKVQGHFYQTKFLFWEERIVGFYQSFQADAEITKVFDPEGNLISDEKTKNKYESKSYGMVLDLTDDPIDPRKGVTIGQKHQPNLNDSNLYSDITVIDSDITAYIPFFKADTLVLNYYTSLSRIDRAGVTDEPTARQIMNQGCEQSSPAYLLCKQAEDKLVEDFLAYNRYGSAIPLGGVNRLRSYPIGRFTAGNTSFQGMEYRYNFSNKVKKINWFFFGGIETLMQLAFFYERGTVAEDPAELNSNMKDSYGMGFRALISGFVYRLDFALGEEGLGTTLFIDYPMLLNPIVN